MTIDERFQSYQTMRDNDALKKYGETNENWLSRIDTTLLERILPHRSRLWIIEGRLRIQVVEILYGLKIYFTIEKVLIYLGGKKLIFQ